MDAVGAEWRSEGRRPEWYMDWLDAWMDGWLERAPHDIASSHFVDAPPWIPSKLLVTGTLPASTDPRGSFQCQDSLLTLEPDQWLRNDGHTCFVFWIEAPECSTLDNWTDQMGRTDSQTSHWCSRSKLRSDSWPQGCHHVSDILDNDTEERSEVSQSLRKHHQNYPRPVSQVPWPQDGPSFTKAFALRCYCFYITVSPRIYLCSMLSEISQTQNNYYVTPLIGVTEGSQIIEMGCTVVVARGWEVRESLVSFSLFFFFVLWLEVFI